MLVLLTVPTELVLVLDLLVSPNPNLSWNLSFLLLWLVSWVSTVWLSQLSWSKKVKISINNYPFEDFYLDIHSYSPSPSLTPNLILIIVNTRGDYTLYNGYAHLCAGLCCGLSSLVRNCYQSPKTPKYDIWNINKPFHLNKHTDYVPNTSPLNFRLLVMLLVLSEMQVRNNFVQDFCKDQAF